MAKACWKKAIGIDVGVVVQTVCRAEKNLILRFVAVTPRVCRRRHRTPLRASSFEDMQAATIR
jgi:hypothetical protein